MPLKRRYFALDLRRIPCKRTPYVIEFHLSSKPFAMPSVTPLEPKKFVQILDEQLALCKNKKQIAESKAAKGANHADHVVSDNTAITAH